MVNAWHTIRTDAERSPGRLRAAAIGLNVRRGTERHRRGRRP